MAGDFTSAWTLALCQELAESVADGDGVVLGLHVVRLRSIFIEVATVSRE